MAILGILAAIAVSNFQHALIRSKIAHTYVDMKTIHTAVQSFISSKMETINFSLGKGGIFFGSSYLLYVPLTTPVAYLPNTDVAKDIFREKFTPEEGGICWKDTYYVYLSIQGSVESGWNNGMFYMSSIGPDNRRSGVNHFDERNRLQFPRQLTYSSTNGLLSKGDVIWSAHYDVLVDITEEKLREYLELFGEP